MNGSGMLTVFSVTYILMVVCLLVNAVPLAEETGIFMHLYNLSYFSQ